jgi:hypothetical protein
MSSVDNGNQILTYDYREEMIAYRFNRLNYKISSRGIYQGGELIRTSDTTVSVTPFVCLCEDDSGVSAMAIRIETQTLASVINVIPSKPYIIGTFKWYDLEDNYMNIQSSDATGIGTNDIIFGRAIFTGSTLVSFDLSETTYSTPNLLKFNSRVPFKTIPNIVGNAYTKQVLVYPGGPFFFNNKIIETTDDTILTLGDTSANGRTDIVYLDSNDNVIKLLLGNGTAGAPMPNLNSAQFPVAIIKRIGINTEVNGSHIQQINPFHYMSNSNIFREVGTTIGKIWVS